MKTQYELKFEKTVVAMILAYDGSRYNQLDLFMDFSRNSCDYYDSICDALYFMSSGQTSDILWLTPSGKPYLAAEQRSEADYKWISANQLPEFEDDLKEQLETALAALQGLLSNASDRVCVF